MSTDVVTLIATLVALAVGLPGILAYRNSERLRKERDSTERRTVDQATFDKVNAVQEAMMENMARRLTEAEARTARTEQARDDDRHVMQLLAGYTMGLMRTMRRHRGPGPIEPDPIPPELNTVIWEAGTQS